MITRSDLTHGQQASQLCHAMRQFTHDHPHVDREWFDNSNFICLLSVQDERELRALMEKAARQNIPCSHFREEDLDNALTAICLSPGQPTKKLVSSLKLAFKGN